MDHGLVKEPNPPVTTGSYRTSGVKVKACTRNSGEKSAANHRDQHQVDAQAAGKWQQKGGLRTDQQPPAKAGQAGRCPWMPGLDECSRI